MKLLRLDIKRFGRFEDFSVDFCEGLNVFLGGNETGKSTVVQALCTVLFDDPTQITEEVSNFGNWSTEHPFLLHLEYQHGGKTFKLTKDVSTQLSLLEEVESGSKWNSLKEVQEQITQALGFSEKEFYLATSFIRQGDLSGVVFAADLIKDKLEVMLNNNKDEMLASRLLEKIHGRVIVLKNNEHGRTCEIAALEKRIADWKIELNAIKIKTVDLMETRRKVQSTGNELAVSRKLFEDKHDLFKKSKQAFEAEQGLAQEREIYLELSRRTKDAQEIRNSITVKKETLKSMLRIEKSDLKSTEILAAQNQLNQLRAKDSEARLERETESVRLAQPKKWYKFLAFAGFAGTIFWSLMGLKSSDAVHFISAAAALIVAVVSCSLWFSAVTAFRRAQEKRSEALHHTEYEREEYKKSEDTLLALLNRYNCKNVDELSEKYDEFRDLDRDIKSMVTQYESLLGENNLKDLENDLEKMNQRMSQQQEVFNRYRAYAITSEKLELLQKEVAQLDRKITQMQEDLEIQEHKLKFIESGTDTMAPLQERIEEGELQLSRLQNEAETLTIMGRYLEGARRKVLKSSLEVLEEESSIVFNRLTQGVWKEVRFDRQSLQSEVSVDGMNWLPSSTGLSKGALDSLHLATRLALIKVVSGDFHPPLVLEDPMVFLDEERQKESLKLLRELSKYHQIVLFTTNKLYAEYADNQTELRSDPAIAAAPSLVSSR